MRGMFFIWVLIMGLLQMTALRDVNLLAVAAVFSGFRKGPLWGFLIGAVIGMFAEILSASAFGFNIALYGIVGLLSGIAKSHIYYKEDVLMQVVFSFCGVFLFYFLYFILSGTIQASIFFTAFFSAAISPLIFRIVEKSL